MTIPENTAGAEAAPEPAAAAAPSAPALRGGRWINRTVIGIGLASLFSDMSHETVTAVLPRAPRP